MAAALRIDDASRRWWILAATGASLGIVLLDETVVGVALPTIRDELGMSQLFSHWIVNAYMLVLTVLVAAAGRLGDVLGQRPTFLAGCAIFGIASIGSGLAQSGEWIIVTRAVQGAGAAVLFSCGAAMTGIAFSESQRGFALGIYGVVGTIALALGPFVGGLLTELASWRWIFFVNLPLVAVVIAITAAAWREPPGAGPRPGFDSRGVAALALLLGPLVLALMQAPAWGWGSPITLGLFAVAAVAVPLFVRAERRARDPLIELDLLRRPTVVGSNLVLFTGQFSKVALIVFGALYLQEKLEMSPLAAGAALLVAMALVVPSAPVAGRLTDRLGSRPPVLWGVAALALSVAWIAALAGEQSYLLLIPGLLVYGASQGFVFVPPMTAVMNAVPAEARGEAGGILISSQMLGGTLAVAVLGTALIDVGFTAVFAITAAVSAAVWLAGLLTIQRPPTRRVAPAVDATG